MKRQESRAFGEKEGAKRQRLLEETAEEREACRWESVKKHGKKRLLKRKVSKGLSSQRYVPMIL